MTLTNIVNQINKRLAGELLRYEDVVIFLDAAIDDINTKLNTCFPVFSDLRPGIVEYTAIPDKYIRTVVIPGAVTKFYEMDEEGAYTAPVFSQEYNNNLFYMERDYLLLVPDEYIASDVQGTYVFDESHPLADGGIDFYGNSI